MFYDSVTKSYTDIFGVMSYANSIMRGGFKGPQIAEWTTSRFQLSQRYAALLFPKG